MAARRHDTMTARALWPCVPWSLLGGGAAAGRRCQMCGLVRFGAWLLVPLQGAARNARGVFGRVRFGAWVLALLEGAAECRCSVLPTNLFATWGPCWRKRRWPQCVAAPLNPLYACRLPVANFVLQLFCRPPFVLQLSSCHASEPSLLLLGVSVYHYKQSIGETFAFIDPLCPVTEKVTQSIQSQPMVIIPMFFPTLHAVPKQAQNYRRYHQHLTQSS